MVCWNQAAMSDSGDSSASRKKSFSSRFSSRMDKLSNPFKKGDKSDSDSEDDSSTSGKSKSRFGKLQNPFKKGHGSNTDDDDDDRSSSSSSPQKGRKFSRPGRSPAMPSHPAASPQLPEASKAPIEAGLDRGEAQPEVATAAAAVATAAAATATAAAPPAPVPNSKSPILVTPTMAAAPAVLTRAALAPTADKAPARTADAVQDAQPARATDASATAPTAAAPAPAPEPEPKKPRETVGGPVSGAPEILLTGVKGDPDEVMKTLRARGFVVHLVRHTTACNFFFLLCQLRIECNDVGTRTRVHHRSRADCLKKCPCLIETTAVAPVCAAKLLRQSSPLPHPPPPPFSCSVTGRNSTHDVFYFALYFVEHVFVFGDIDQIIVFLCSRLQSVRELCPPFTRLCFSF